MNIFYIKAILDAYQWNWQQFAKRTSNSDFHIGTKFISQQTIAIHQDVKKQELLGSLFHHLDDQIDIAKKELIAIEDIKIGILHSLFNI